MGDSAEVYRAWNKIKKERRQRLGEPCPECVAKLPKAHPSILLPGQKCKIHGYRDPRKREE